MINNKSREGIKIEKFIDIILFYLQTKFTKRYVMGRKTGTTEKKSNLRRERDNKNINQTKIRPNKVYSNIRYQGDIVIVNDKEMRAFCIEWSRKGHVIMQRIKIVLHAYSLVRFLCHDSKYRSLHSKPTLSHTSPFSSHRKDIRSCNSICGAFLDKYQHYQHRHSAPIFLFPFLRFASFTSSTTFTLHSPCSSSPHAHLPLMPYH